MAGPDCSCAIRPDVPAWNYMCRQIGPGDDDEFFADQALGLEPQALLAREVWLIDPLRHDALDTQLAGMLSEERASPTTW